MAYVYSHVRKDTGETFYIGCSCKKRYKRAYDACKRNKYWKAIARKAGYEVRILFEGLSKKEAYEMEVELISLYGRSDKGEGPLCNMTDGGDRGPVGNRHTALAKAKIRAAKEGSRNPFSKLTKKKVISIREEIKQEGVTIKMLAKKYKVTYAAIFSVVSRRNWKSV